MALESQDYQKLMMGLHLQPQVASREGAIRTKRYHFQEQRGGQLFK